MTSSPSVRAASTLTWRMVVAASRGIARTKLGAAFLLGCAYALYDLLISFRVVLEHELPLRLLVTNFAVDQIYAFCLMLCVAIADRETGTNARRRVAYVLAIVVGTTVATPLGILVMKASIPGLDWRVQTDALHGFVAWLTLGGIVTFAYHDWQRAQAARARLHAAQIARASTAKRMFENRLQALQARVEPQFLFNTLAEVRDLYRAGARRGERKLDELILYLRAAIPTMRDASSTSGQELDLVRAYLAVVSVRLDDTFGFEVETAERTPAPACPQ